MNLPQYAAHVPHSRLVRLFCKQQCNRMVYAELKREHNPVTAGNNGGDDRYLGYIAYCLLCGGRALDSYNWRAP